MEIKEILKEVEKEAERRKVKSTFNHPIRKLEQRFKGLGFKFSRNREIKKNPIIKLSWYKNMVYDITKHPNIINNEDVFYRYGVRMKFNGFLSIKYLPYLVKVCNNLTIKGAKFEESELIGNVFKNFERCFYCNKSVNLKHKDEYEYRDGKCICRWCFDVLEAKNGL